MTQRDLFGNVVEPELRATRRSVADVTDRARIATWCRVLLIAEWFDRGLPGDWSARGSSTWLPLPGRWLPGSVKHAEYMRDLLPRDVRVDEASRLAAVDLVGRVFARGVRVEAAAADLEARGFWPVGHAVDEHVGTACGTARQQVAGPRRVRR